MKLRRRKTLLLILARHRIKQKRKEALGKEKRRFRVRSIFAERQTKGEFHTLVADMKLFDHEYFQKQFRMSPTRLEELLGWITPRIINNSEKRQAIGPEERLYVTLRYGEKCLYFHRWTFELIFFLLLHRSKNKISCVDLGK